MTEEIEEAAEVEERLNCMYAHGKRATQTLRVQGQGVLVVCTPCAKELHGKNKSKRCQYCGVPILPGWSKSAMPGFHHQPNCPRNPEDVEVLEIDTSTHA